MSHSNHVGKPLNRLGEARDRLFRVSVFKSVPDTMADVPLQYDLPHLMQGGLGGIELSKNIFTGNVFVKRASQDKPSVLEQLRALKAKVLSLTPDKARNKDKGLEL